MKIQKNMLALFMSVTAILVFGLVGLAADEPVTSPPVTPKEEMVVSRPQAGGESGEAVIGHLETRDQVISITTGPDGPLYTIRSDEGEEIATHLTKEELATRFPDLHEKIEKSMADPKIWAGIELFLGQDTR